MNFFPNVSLIFFTALILLESILELYKKYKNQKLKSLSTLLKIIVKCLLNN